MTVNHDSNLVGQQVCDLESELDFTMILHSRGGTVDLHPDPKTELQAGDRICVFASLDVLNRLGRLNRGEL
jgi:Trk K+ transport system NAD-binding subunit